MPEPQSDSATPAQALRTTRVVWGVLLVGVLVVGAVILAVAAADPPEPRPSHRHLLFLLAAGLLCVLTPVGLFVRNQTYKAHWRGLAVSPGGYAKGNLILFAILTAVAVAAFVLIVFAGPHAGLLGVAAVAVLVHLANFPTGAPMRPREPSLREPEKP